MLLMLGQIEPVNFRAGSCGLLRSALLQMGLGDFIL